MEDLKLFQTPTKIGKINELITNDRKLTITKMSKASGIKRFSVWKMMKNRIKGKKLRPCKNPYKLTENMKQKRCEMVSENA